MKNITDRKYLTIIINNERKWIIQFHKKQKLFSVEADLNNIL